MKIFPLNDAIMLDFIDEIQATCITTFTGKPIAFSSDATHYIVVQKGEFVITLDNNNYTLRTESFGAFPGPARLQGKGNALIVSAAKYRGPLLLGGPIEKQGRLRYIDGCSSSLLLPPAVKGEPCLNFLHLPPQISQTMHTHPTLRTGLILSGNGKCETLEGRQEFSAGTAFVIPPGVAHSFQSQQEEMRIVIYHPDSDSGPTHENHTMLNRTFIDGVSAQSITALHTQMEAQ
jgi:mannose-6-phosphate isomerase-like protein (cupin superfamily)